MFVNIFSNALLSLRVNQRKGKEVKSIKIYLL